MSPPFEDGFVDFFDVDDIFVVFGLEAASKISSSRKESDNELTLYVHGTVDH